VLFRRACLLVLLLVGASAWPAPVQRIVSLAPHLTELTFTAGAGERLVAVAEYSDYPDAARALPRVGDAFRVDYEKLLSLRPELVLAWESGMPRPVIERMRNLGLNVVTIETHRLSDVAAALRTIGRLAQTSSIAEPAARQFEREIEALRVEYRARAPISVFLQINDRPLYTVNDRQIMSEILRLCGGRNVFGHLSDLAPAIGIEAVLAADPQAIIATDDAVRDAAAQWREWPQLTAVRHGNVFTLPADAIARSTTRLTAGAVTVCRTLDTARAQLRSAGKD
jgi:iron complex transport system substrate-binding protein